MKKRGRKIIDARRQQNGTALGRSLVVPHISAVEQRSGTVAPGPYHAPLKIRKKHNFILFLPSSSFKLFHFLSLQSRLPPPLSPHSPLKSPPQTLNFPPKSSNFTHKFSFSSQIPSLFYPNSPHSYNPLSLSKALTLQKNMRLETKI